MRLIFVPLLACATLASAEEIAKTPPELALEPPKAGVPLAMPSYSAPAERWRDLRDALPPSPEECRDRIRQIREQNGQPELRRETADDEEPLMLWAVDRREDGCSVMVVKDNPDDIRPIPKTNGEVKLRPAGDQ